MALKMAPPRRRTSMPTDESGPSHDDDSSRSGSTVDESVAAAEAGSQVEGVHIPSGQAESGDSRLEHMPEVSGVAEPRIDGDPDADLAPPPAGPGPLDIGSAGAQRIVGARISDRISADEPVPDGPPFTEEISAED
jgi:hypothetical protein